MESESAIAIFFKSIIYPFSPPSRLVEGGIVGTLCFILIGLPFLYGYQVRCGRSILKGSDRLPNWEPSTDLFSPGIRALIIAILYGIIAYLISYVIRAILATPASDFTPEYLIAVLVQTIVVGVISLPVTMMAAISLIIYIDTDNLMRALNPENPFKILISWPVEFVKAWVAEFVAGFIVALPFTLLSLFLTTLNLDLGMLCLLVIPLVVFAGLMFYVSACIRVFIWTKFYRRVTGGSIDRPAAGLSSA